MKRMIRLAAILLAVCILVPATGMAIEEREDERGWIDFILVCNEGMNNSGGNAGNTMMVVSMNPDTGKIRLMMMAWDTFIDYPGYDLPQKLDTPFFKQREITGKRQSGPADFRSADQDLLQIRRGVKDLKIEIGNDPVQGNGIFLHTRPPYDRFTRIIAHLRPRL